MVEGPLAARARRRSLQLHRYATVLVDPAAAAGSAVDYYREVYDGKPDWQRL